MVEYAVAAALLLFVTGFVAGGLGALAGIGGGILLVPVMNAGFGVPFKVAVGCSLVAVVASSSGSAARYLGEGLCDVRLGIRLEVATVLGAIAGGLAAPWLPVNFLRALFGLMTLYLAAWQLRSARAPVESDVRESGPIRNYPAGIAFSGLAGMVSALLGIGGGALKVPVMNMLMGVPFRVSTATSNYMIGITAAASGLLYFRRGEVDLGVTAPMVLGVMLGSAVGARMMPLIPVPRLRVVFAGILLVITGQMFWRAAGMAARLGGEPPL